jgi:hypothetical protein
MCCYVLLLNDCCGTHKITSRLMAAMNSSAMMLNRHGLRFFSTWPAAHNSKHTSSSSSHQRGFHVMLVEIR